MSWFHARHSVKAGIIIAPHFHADKLASPDLFGTTTFTNRFTGFPYADFLLEIPSTAARAYPPIGYRRHWLNDNFFVTDDFKVNSKLTSIWECATNIGRISRRRMDARRSST